MDDRLDNNKNRINTGRTIAQTAILMAILTLISKCLGFVREMVIAGCFGTSYIVDAYVMANSIPGMLFGGIFASIGTAYMPIFSRITEKDGEDEGNTFTSEVINLATVFALIAFVIGAIFAEPLVNLIAPKFNQETASLTIFYLKITFSYMIFSCGASICDAYLQYKGKFLKPIISGYLQNIGIIIIAAISAATNHKYLAFGFVLGYAMRYAFILVSARNAGFRYKARFAFGSPVRQIVALALPVFFGSCISQLNTFVDKTLASGLQEGSIAALNYGGMLVNLITGLTASIISAIVYPKITQVRSNDNWNFFNVAVEKGMTIIAMIAIPFELGAIAFAEDVVQIVYERGAFDASATDLTGSAFLYYSIGLAFIALNQILTYVFYSMHDMKTPVICGAFGVATNIAVSISLIGAMQHKGLALGTSAAAIVNFILLYSLLMMKYKQVKIFKSKRKLAKIIISATVAVAIAIAVHSGLMAAIWMPRLVYLGVAVLAACIVYLALLVIFKVDEVKIIKDIVRR